MTVFYSANQSATYQRRRKKHEATKRSSVRRPAFKKMEPTKTFVPRDGADHSKIQSRGVGSSVDSGTRKESPKYTGTYVKGISTMHKSNAVPIVSEEQAKEHSQMRRN